MSSYVLKIRCGSETYVKKDGTVGTAGKGGLVSEECAFTLSTGSDQTLVDGWTVRRLTPMECERLQGFPDGYTDIPYKGKDHPADGARYKALGNSMAVPVMRWIGERMGIVDGMLKNQPVAE